MSRFCQVAVPLPLATAFDYAVPADLRVQAGQRVRVPFGKRHLTGVVTALLEQSSAKGLKPIDAVLEEAPSLSPAMLEFTRWVADYYCCGWGEALALALPPPGRVQAEPWAVVADPDALQALAESLNTRQARSREALLGLLSAGAQPLAALKAAGLSPAVLTKAGKALRREKRLVVPPVIAAPVSAPILNEAQAAAAAAIEAALAQKGSTEAFLLQGVTGSGKTEVYLQALQAVRAADGGAIVLVPEIALTPQTWARFEARFPGEVAVLHSNLSAGERARAWADLAAGRKRIALGPRSALFAPVQGLRLLVVDEESEPSYKQENAPRYHARDAALVRAKLEKAVCVLGSATPSFEARQNAATGKLTALHLPLRHGSNGLPPVEFVDLNAWDKQHEAAEDAISPALAEALRATLAKGEQSLVFLNRRGFAPVWACAHCGQAVECGQCSIPMTYHRGRTAGSAKSIAFAGRADTEHPMGHLQCHLCGRSQKPKEKCENPKCGRPLMRAQGVGTQRLEQELQRLLPTARIQRVDRDSAQAVGFHDRLGQRMHAGEIDVLVGTQMLAKGLDFPRLTLVGVVNADSSLSFPDFRATERTFQLLVQVAGRAGRAGLPGRVLIQTRQPSHDCLRAVATQDFESFFQASLPERRDFSYPPFGRLAALVLRGQDKAKVERRADELAQKLTALSQQEGQAVQVLGPAPSPLVLVKGCWRYRLLLKSNSAKALHALIQTGCSGWKDAAVQLQVDIDPLSFL
jgi:primosomal protein N' (replication factor Y)